MNRPGPREKRDGRDPRAPKEELIAEPAIID